MEHSFSHLDEQGKARMVDISAKSPVERQAVAGGFIRLAPDTLRLVAENNIKKGDVLTVAQIAGIQAAKQTSSLIPLCHPLLLNHIQLDFLLHDNGIEAVATVNCHDKTGVEMEALTAVSVSLLTIYDMCKAVDKDMIISDIKLIQKTKK